MRTKPQTITTAAGAKTVIDAERICHREFLTPVRAFYLDLAQWAVDDPARWGPGLLPAPSARRTTIQGKIQRHRKSRMDARTRERLPVLPVLVRSAAQQHADARALLQAARDTRPGDAITAPETALSRSGTPPARRHRLGRRPGHRETPQPHRRRRPRILGLGDRRDPARYRHPRRGTGAAQPSQLRAVPAPRHRRAGAAAADRPVQDRRRAAAGHQPRARRRAQRNHQPDPRHQPRRAPRRRLRRSRTPVAAARPGAVPAAYRRREPRDPRRHHPQDPRRRPGPHRPDRPRRGGPLHYTPTTSAGCSSPTPS